MYFIYTIGVVLKYNRSPPPPHYNSILLNGWSSFHPSSPPFSCKPLASRQRTCARTRPSLHPPPPSPIFTATTTHPPYHHFSFAIHTHQPHCSTPNPTTNMNQNYTFFFKEYIIIILLFGGEVREGVLGYFSSLFFYPNDVVRREGGERGGLVSLSRSCCG